MIFLVIKAWNRNETEVAPTANVWVMRAAATQNVHFHFLTMPNYKSNDFRRK